MKVRAFSFLLVSALAALASEPAASPNDQQLRTAATRAVSLLVKTNKVWWEKQACASCHHQATQIIAFRMAAERNIPFDQQVAAMTAQKTFSFGERGGLESALQGTHAIDPSLGEALFMFTASENGVPRNFGLSASARLLAGMQRPDGSWMSFDQRPPQMYGTFSSTALSLRAVKAYASPRVQADTDARVARAARWLASHEPRTSEEAIYRLFGLLWAGTEPSAAAKAADAVAALQHNDGGWGQDTGFLSDAYTTAEALYALNTAGVATTDPVYRRGLNFLTSTQAEDGSWLVRTRMVGPAPLSPPYFESGFPYGKDQFISVTATGWAALAIMKAIAPAGQVAAKPAAPAQPAVPEWIETAMFGTSDELKMALDAGLDPNQATPDGTTVLMLVQPDLAKTQLLIGRGAKVATRAKSGYDALLVASHFQNSAATIKLLLEHGANVALPKGAKPAMFGANPVFWAAFSGDVQTAKVLLDGGARIDAAMSLGGLLPPWTPLQIAAMNGDAAMVELLASRGADVNAGDSFGVTPLSRAVLRNALDTARVLVAHGAKINATDPIGMTPLLYAATRDYGDTQMVRFLLASGANPAARNKEGKTAAASALLYGHNQIAQALQ